MLNLQILWIYGLIFKYFGIDRLSLFNPCTLSVSIILFESHAWVLGTGQYHTCKVWLPSKTEEAAILQLSITDDHTMLGSVVETTYRLASQFLFRMYLVKLISNYIQQAVIRSGSHTSENIAYMSAAPLLGLETINRKHIGSCAATRLPHY